jgi:hypothetical protein
VENEEYTNGPGPSNGTTFRRLARGGSHTLPKAAVGRCKEAMDDSWASSRPNETIYSTANLTNESIARPLRNM